MAIASIHYLRGVIVPQNNRLEYWKEKARQAEADFYAVTDDHNKADEQVIHLAEMIRATREIDRITNGVDFPSWL